MLAERLRARVAEMPFLYDDLTVPLTVSICAVQAPAPDPPSPEALLNAAVAGIIVSKASGRDRVLVR